MKRSLLIPIILGLSLQLNACKDNQEENQSAPAIPPMESLEMNFDQFPKNNNMTLSLSSQSLDPAPIQAQATYTNFGHAVTQVAVWSTLLRVGLAIPVAAFRESFRHPADLRADNVWVWSYAVRIDGIIHTVELHATVSEEFVDWEMYVTKPGYYLDFNWISGVSNRDGSGGRWILRESPDAAQDLLEIRWSRDIQNRVANVTYTNIKPNAADNGAYISYGLAADPSYDAYFDIYQKVQNNLVEIEWNRFSHNGRVKNPLFFNGSLEWHYWDESLQDVTP